MYKPKRFCSSNWVQKNELVLLSAPLIEVVCLFEMDMLLWLVCRPTGIVSTNIGGPRTVSETHDFPPRLFNNGDFIPLPFQLILAPSIAKKQTQKIENQYADIGKGSLFLSRLSNNGDWIPSPFQSTLAPLTAIRQTPKIEKQHADIGGEHAFGTMKNLDELRSETASHRPDLAFCYAHPRTETCLDDMKGGGSNELYRHLIRNSKDGPSPTKRSVVNRWPTHPAFIEIRVHVEQALELYDPLVQLKVILLFSAHSLPMSSQVVPSAWLGPQTSDALKGYVKKGVNEMLLIPITFASAHIYTK
ncbi:hypothetical protein MJO28_005048 [Puccinia striiformis f. sp. tritici]|uniref:Ferrochelatase n=2 Tax=Puccinia striiformis TaxID=27350 RepID=A0A2S4USW3_9BASI|nr:hypothetical protein MJO28_005048 [Puccinia striiformis f. sp. tritici]POW00393.1 hypothetical protein PSHT_13052 [Puccinia striiformis]